MAAATVHTVPRRPTGPAHRRTTPGTAGFPAVPWGGVIAIPLLSGKEGDAARPRWLRGGAGTGAGWAWTGLVVPSISPIPREIGKLVVVAGEGFEPP
ncbi:MAG: hypothetical protein ACR2OE_13055, partial [Thermomicrobiales bacterium]